MVSTLSGENFSLKRDLNHAGNWSKTTYGFMLLYVIISYISNTVYMLFGTPLVSSGMCHWHHRLEHKVVSRVFHTSVSRPHLRTISTLLDLKA